MPSARMPSARMPSAPELADRLDDTTRANDHGAAIRKGDLSRPERWPLCRTDEIDAYRSELEQIGNDADDLLRRAGQLEASDRTLAEAVAYGARARTARLETSVELTSITPSAGHVALALTFLPRHGLVSADDGERYLARVAAFPRFVEEWSARLRDAATAGVTPATALVTGQIEMIDRALGSGLTSILGVQPAPNELSEADAARWRAELHRLLEHDVEPSFARLRDVLTDHTLPHARSDDRPGLCHLAGGDEIYRRLLWSHTSVDTTPSRVHEIGLAQIDRLGDEYREVAGPLLGTDDRDEIFRRLRDDASMRYADADAIVADATAALDTARAAAPKWFHRLPAATCTPHPIQQGALAFYSPPSPNGAKQGEFFFHTGDPSAWATYQLEAVTYHESIPGHHLQLALAIELDDVHPLLEQYLVPAYCEGWGLYTERLADEMGLYSTDLSRVGMLSADSMRAGRLVVDTGIHALGWTRQQAIDFLAANSPLSLPQIAGEIDRYIGAPAQACSYMIGRLAIDDARARAEHRLGDGFDIRDFHDVVLSTGSVPLDTLDRVVDEWVDARRSGISAS
jgi:uncharacterized protein (DUF885 family)